MSTKVSIKKERVVRADGELWHTSWCLLKSGQENEVGSTHQFRASLVFTAFALEAYLNHIGAILFKSWETIERKLTPNEKLTLICEHLKIDMDWSARPWQTVKALMRYRNSLAHGRGDKLTEQWEDSIEHYAAKLHEQILTEWERYASADTAIQARSDVEDIVHRLHKQSGVKHDFPFSFGMQSGSATAS
jgi:hypothetical protein